MKKTWLLLLLVLILNSTAFAESKSYFCIPKVTDPPKIDGLVSAGEWDKASVTTGFFDVQALKTTDRKTRVYACYDNTSLYLLFECFGEDTEHLKASAKGRDASVWEDSSIELFIAPGSWQTGKYAHLGISCTGAFADEMVDHPFKDLSWNGNWQVAAGKNKDAWFAEVAMPFSDLGVTPVPGTDFSLNFTRNVASIQYLDSWSYVIGSFHKPAEFGRMKLTGEGKGVRILDISGINSPSAKITAASINRDELYLNIKALNRSEVVSQQKTKLDPNREFNYKIPNAASSVLYSISDSSEKPLFVQEVFTGSDRISTRLNNATAQIKRLSKKTVPHLSGEYDITGIKSEYTSIASDYNSADKRIDYAALSERLKRIEHRLNILDLFAKPGKYSTSDYAITSLPSTTKVLPDGSDFGMPVAQARIAMCKGEYEPAQIVVMSYTKDLKNVKVSASDLKGPIGAIIPASRIEVNPIGYVKNNVPSPGSTMRDIIPDVVLPNRAMNVSAKSPQPYFITVKTNPEDAAGEYSGTITIDVKNSQSTKFPVKVRVYDISIPKKSHLRTVFALWGNFKTYLTGDYMETYLRYAKFALKYRITPEAFFMPYQNPDGSFDFSDVDRYMNTMVPEGITSANIGANGWLVNPERGPLAKAIADHYKSKGWWDLCYVYGYDEAPTDSLRFLKDSYGALMKSVPDIKIMQTGWNPGGALDGYVQIWCPATEISGLKNLKTARDKGEETWWYVCMGPRLPYPNLFTDNPGIDHRILGWQTYKYGLQGFLYWGLDVWSNLNTKSAAEYDKNNYADFDSRGGTFGGDGYLLYPGPNDTPIASIRIALLRDGFEDYDLFTEAAALAAKAGKSGEKLKKMLSLDGAVNGLVYNYETDGWKLLQKREEILKAAEKLNN